MLVKATRLGYYGDKRVREGATFYINSEKEFSSKWMKKVKTSRSKIQEESFDEADETDALPPKKKRGGGKEEVLTDLNQVENDDQNVI
jgi:hypothetical protein